LSVQPMGSCATDARKRTTATRCGFWLVFLAESQNLFIARQYATKLHAKVFQSAKYAGSGMIAERPHNGGIKPRPSA
jgi:lactam utilization protein B